jgi:hypothetical protein
MVVGVCTKNLEEENLPQDTVVCPDLPNIDQPLTSLVNFVTLFNVMV